MFSRLHVRGRATTLRRSVLGLLGVLWLNMAVLPCAMAFQGDDDCPHCPPAEQHDEKHAMAAHHGHSEAETKPSCATEQTDCCDAIAASIDARSGKLDYKPGSDAAFVTLSPPDHTRRHFAAMWDTVVDPPDIVGSSPRLHVLFCVYLD